MQHQRQQQHPTIIHSLVSHTPATRPRTAFGKVPREQVVRRLVVVVQGGWTFQRFPYDTQRTTTLETIITNRLHYIHTFNRMIVNWYFMEIKFRRPSESTDGRRTVAVNTTDTHVERRERSRKERQRKRSKSLVKQLKTRSLCIRTKPHNPLLVLFQIFRCWWWWCGSSSLHFKH